MDREPVGGWQNGCDVVLTNRQRAREVHFFVFLLRSLEVKQNDGGRQICSSPAERSEFCIRIAIDPPPGFSRLQSVPLVSSVTDEQGHHYRCSAGTPDGAAVWLWWSRCLHRGLGGASVPPDGKGSGGTCLFLKFTRFPRWVTSRVRLAVLRKVRCGNIKVCPLYLDIVSAEYLLSIHSKVTFMSSGEVIMK